MKGLRQIAIIWQLPLGAASYLFFVLTKKLFVMLGQRHFGKHPEQFRVWKPLTGETLKAPSILERYMVTGPRWNTHAFIAVGGPISITANVKLNKEPLDRSANYWAVCVYHFPSFRMMGAINALQCQEDAADKQISFDLGPGNYYIGVRLYDPEPQVHYPALIADTQPLVPALSVEQDGNAFYADLREHDRFMFRAMHYYVYVAVLWRKILPNSFVDRELLPVGDAFTTFHYGTLATGERLAFNFDSKILADHNVYCTTYTRSSLPADYFTVDQSDFLSAPATEPVVYLIRIVQVRRALDNHETKLANSFTPPQVVPVRT